MRQFVLATRNQDKFEEVEGILKGEPFKLLSLADFKQAGEVEEDGETFLANAQKKARTCHRTTGMASLADDSGLEVDALGGAPGVFSSRFAGENATSRENNEKLLRLMEGVPEKRRSARFRCVVVLVDEHGEAWVEGQCEGMILYEYRGKEGFGYDPLFYVPEARKTFAEMSREEKNGMSHRGRAFRSMAEHIRMNSMKYSGA